MDISPRHVSRAVSFGKTLLERKITKEAIQVFEKAISLSKNSTQLREEVAQLCFEKGEKEYGAKLLESILRSDPSRHDLCLQLGEALVDLEQHSKALNYLNMVDGKEKNNLQAKKCIAKAFIGLRKPIRAEQALKEVLAIDPNDMEALELRKQCV